MQLERHTKLQRSFAISSTEYNAETNEIAISFSSEKPVLRDFGYEVLKHQKSAINEERTAGGLPLLWNHNRDQILGRAQGIALDTRDKKLRAVVKFSRNEFAQNVLRDIQDGIVSDVSFGYSIDDWEVDESKRSADGIPTLNVTRWTPFEVSFVTIPADISVGVGRSMDCEDQTKREDAETPADEASSDPEEQTEQRATDLVDGDNDSEVSEPETEKETESQGQRSQEKDKNDRTINTTQTPTQQDQRSYQLKENYMENSTRQETLALMGLAEKLGLASEVREMLASERSAEQIKSEMLSLAASKQAKVSSEPHIDARELKGYSISRAIRAQISNDWSKAGLEREASEFVSKKLNREAAGFFVPSNAFRAANTMNTGTTGQGGELVFSEYAGFIEMLRPACKVMGLGAQLLAGLSNNYTYVQESSAPVTYWVGENPDTDVPDTTEGLTTKTLSPKQLMAQMSYTRSQLMQGVEAIDTLIMNRLVREHAIALDAAAIGYKSVVANAPTGGILMGGGIQSIALGTNGAAISANASKILGLKTLLNTANALVDSCAFLTTPGIQGVLESTVPPGLTYATAAYWSNDRLSGYRAAASSNVPSNLDKGTSTGVCHAVIFGDFSQLVVADFGALDITVDPYTLGGKGVTRLISNQLADVGLLRPTSFAAIKDALAS